MNMSRIELLQGMPVFGATSAETLALLLDGSRSVTVAEGDYFFRRDDQAESFFVIEQGRVEILREHEQQFFCLNELARGDCFGEMSVIECRNRNASVRALSTCMAIEIALSTLHALYRCDVEQYLLIQMNLSRELSRRLREADRRLFAGMVAASEDTRNDWWYSA